MNYVGKTKVELFNTTFNVAWPHPCLGCNSWDCSDNCKPDLDFVLLWSGDKRPRPINKKIRGIIIDAFVDAGVCGSLVKEFGSSFIFNSGGISICFYPDKSGQGGSYWIDHPDYDDGEA